MKVACIDCVHLSGKNTPREFIKLRLLRCKKAPPNQFFSPIYQRECLKFAPVSAAESKARREWLNKGHSDAQSTASNAETKHSSTATPCSTSSTNTRSP